MLDGYEGTLRLVAGSAAGNPHSTYTVMFCHLVLSWKHEIVVRFLHHDRKYEGPFF